MQVIRENGSPRFEGVARGQLRVVPPRPTRLPVVRAVNSTESRHPWQKLQLHPLCHCHPSFWGFRLCPSTSPSLQETEKMLLLHLLLTVPRSWSVWSAENTLIALSGAGCSPFSQRADSSLLEILTVERQQFVCNFWFLVLLFSLKRGFTVQSGQSNTAGRGSQVPSPLDLSSQDALGTWLAAPSPSWKLHLPVFTWDSSRMFTSEFVKKHILVHTLPLKVGSLPHHKSV